MTDLSQTSPQSGHIASASRITWWGLYLVLNLKHSDRQRRLWVLKGEVSEQDYRRLCRLILQPKDA